MNSKAVVVTQTEKYGEIRWERSDADEVRVEHVAHLMLLEGMTLSQLFAPLILLRAIPPPIWSVPYVLRDVVTAEIKHMEAEEAPLQDIALELMQVVFV